MLDVLLLDVPATPSTPFQRFRGAVSLKTLPGMLPYASRYVSLKAIALPLKQAKQCGSTFDTCPRSGFTYPNTR